MTAPTGPDRDRLREALSATLRRHNVWWAEDTNGPIDALLPVVEAEVARGKAAELAYRASLIRVRATEEPEDVQVALDDTAAWLDARASALRALADRTDPDKETHDGCAQRGDAATTAVCTCGPGAWGCCDTCGVDAWIKHHCPFSCDDVTCEGGSICIGCLTGRPCPVHNDTEEDW